MAYIPWTRCAAPLPSLELILAWHAREAQPVWTLLGGFPSPSILPCHARWRGPSSPCWVSSPQPELPWCTREVWLAQDLPGEFPISQHPFWHAGQHGLPRLHQVSFFLGLVTGMPRRHSLPRPCWVSFPLAWSLLQGSSRSCVPAPDTAHYF